MSKFDSRHLKTKEIMKEAQLESGGDTLQRHLNKIDSIVAFEMDFGKITVE